MSDGKKIKLVVMVGMIVLAVTIILLVFLKVGEVPLVDMTTQVEATTSKHVRIVETQNLSVSVRVWLIDVDGHKYIVVDGSHSTRIVALKGQ